MIQKSISSSMRYFAGYFVLLGLMTLSANAQQVAEEETPVAVEKPKPLLFPEEGPAPYFPVEEEPEMVVEDLPGEETDPESEIVIGDLPEVDPATFGLLGEGGFPRTMWQGTGYARLERLLRALHLPSRSPVMAGLEKKLLLSEAALPTVGSGDNFLALRIGKMTERGNLEDLTAFLQLLPEGTLTVSQDNTDILLMAGDLSGACALTLRAIEQGVEGSDFWLKMLSYCRALEGNREGARLGLDMLSEKGSDDFVYFDLLGRLLDGSEGQTSMSTRGFGRLDALKYSLLTTLEQPLEADMLDEGSLSVLYALATNPALSADLRLEAGVKAYEMGTFSIENMRALYNVQEFADTEYQDAIGFADNNEAATADVLLYQAAARQVDDQQKAEILKTIWERAKNDLPREAVFNEETLASLAPSMELLSHAAHITRGLLLAGNFEQSRVWYEFIRSQAVLGDAVATRALVDVWPLMVIAGGEDQVPWSRPVLDLWWNGQMVLAPESRDQKATLFYALAEALGREVPEDMWRELVGQNQNKAIRPMPLALWRALIRSAKGDRFGETVMLCLMALGEEGPGSLDAAGLSAVVRALRTIGLDKEARAVALEALSARNF